MHESNLVASGYVSIDHIIKLKDEAKAGKTSLIEKGSDAGPYFGGCGVNVSVLLSTLGYSTAPIIRVGHDFKSSGFEKYLKDSNVSLKGVETVQGELTSYSYLVENPSGEHMTFFYPGAMDTKYAKGSDAALFKQSRYALMTVGSKTDNEWFMKQAQNHGCDIVFGMKADYDAFPKMFLKSVLEASSIAFMNESEAEDIQSMFGFKDLKTLLEHTGLRILVVTLGAKGSRYLIKDGEDVKTGHANAITPRRIEDTSGSGDAFIAGFMHGLFTDQSVDTCLKYGALMSAIIIEKQGCTTNRPSLETFKKRFKDQFSEEASS